MCTAYLASEARSSRIKREIVSKGEIYILVPAEVIVGHCRTLSE